MRGTRWMMVALCLGALSMMIAAMSMAGLKSRSAQSSRADRIEHGRYLVSVAGCNDCHTPGTFYGAPDTLRQLSGSELGWEGPWGVSYPRNITPDVETGIGNWTEAQIVTAIRTGQRPDKSLLLPPMPWPMYAHLSDEDAYAIAAYLKSIPAVSHRAPHVQSPGKPATGARLSFPPPPMWDVKHLPPPVAMNASTVK